MVFTTEWKNILTQRYAELRKAEREVLFGTKILNSMYRFFHFKNRLLNGRETAV
jgi:hypothetical protein